MSSPFAIKQTAIRKQITAAMRELMEQGEITRHSMIYFQDRLDVYMDYVTTRYSNLGQTYDFESDPNIQHFEYMIKVESTRLQDMRDKYRRLQEHAKEIAK